MTMPRIQAQQLIAMAYRRGYEAGAEDHIDDTVALEAEVRSLRRVLDGIAAVAGAAGERPVQGLESGTSSGVRN